MCALPPGQAGPRRLGCRSLLARRSCSDIEEVNDENKDGANQRSVDEEWNGFKIVVDECGFETKSENMLTVGENKEFDVACALSFKVTAEGDLEGEDVLGAIGDFKGVCDEGSGHVLMTFSAVSSGAYIGPGPPLHVTGSFLVPMWRLLWSTLSSEQGTLSHSHACGLLACGLLAYRPDVR